jgi:hypothetical protein
VRCTESGSPVSLHLHQRLDQVTAARCQDIRIAMRRHILGRIASVKLVREGIFSEVYSGLLGILVVGQSFCDQLKVRRKTVVEEMKVGGGVSVVSDF